MSILLLIEYSLEVASGKGYCKDLSKDYYRIGRWSGCWKGAGDTGVLNWFLFLLASSFIKVCKDQKDHHVQPQPIPTMATDHMSQCHISTCLEHLQGR